MVEFELHQLGWFSFEQLCRTICREAWRQPVETYSRGSDGGRDGALFGTWIEGTESKPVVLQCKHTTVSRSHISLSDLDEEVAKAKRHVADGRCEVYLLMTNARITGASAEAIEKAFREAGAQVVHLLGYEAICELLTDQKSLRTLVPRLYGLGDLTEILDDRAYAQAEAILAMMHDQIARLVPVEAHRDAHRALREHHFALLIGRPGSGKSSIAASLAIGAMDLYDARPMKLTDIRELRDRWNPRESGQFFWLDDAFGATQYEHQSAADWNRAIPHIIAAMRGGARFIVTSRDYVYAAARNDLKTGSLPVLDEARVVIHVEAFTTQEREQILYNHLRLGRQPKDVLASMRSEHLEAVARDPSFLPELARRLGDPFFTRDVLVRSESSLLGFFRRPTEYLVEVLRNLDGPSRAALGLVHLNGNHLPSPYVAGPNDQEFLEHVGESTADALAALETLDGSLLRLVTVGGERWWQFQHPTFTDAYQLWLVGHPELLAEYISTARLDDLLRTVTCGDVGVEGALIVPRPLYDLVFDRLIALRGSGVVTDGLWRSAALPFLAFRCDEAVLRAMVNRLPEVLDEIFQMSGAHISTLARKTLARTLLDLGLATDEHRVELVESLTDAVAEDLDGTFLDDDDWLWFFTSRELHELDRRVLEEIDFLEERIAEDLKHSEGDPSFAQESVRGFESRYSDNPNVVAARARVDGFTSWTPDDDDESWREEDEEALPSVAAPTERSIFEDVAY